MHRKLSLFTLLLANGMAAAQLTPAGTQITNQATALYQSQDGVEQQATSNTVVTVVQDVCGVSILSNGSLTNPAMTREVLPGDTAVFPYTLTNTGNFTAAIPVTAALEASSAMSPSLSAHVDINGNGQIDTNEPAVQQVTLQAGQAVTILVQAVTTTAQVSGAAYVNLIASCPGGESRDADNISLLTLGQPPELKVDKTFKPEQVRPGEETTVQVSTTNVSNRESRQVTLTDLLNEQLAQGLVFVPGSAVTSAGRIEYFDGQNWQTTAPAQVQGIRVVVDRLAPGAKLDLTFRMRAQERADGRRFVNIASVENSGRTVTDDATLLVKYNPGVAIGPVGNPLAEEGTPADSQTQAFATVGSQVCFDHTLRNTGDAPDLFTVTVTYPVGQAQHVLYGANGQPLAQPIALAPGQETLVRVCYTPAADQPIEAKITVTGERGTSNTTVDYLRPQPKLTKTVVAVTPEVEENNRTLAAIGSEVTYNLTITNTYGVPLTGVRITDSLPEAVDYVSSTGGGRVEGQPGRQKVIWEINQLAPGASVTLEVTVRVTDRAQMGETVANTFEMLSEQLTTVVSPPATVQVPIKIEVKKVASQTQVNLGDRIRFTLTITNPSPVAALVPVDIVDALEDPTTLEYIPGTSTLAYGSESAQKLEDPRIETKTFDTPYAGREAGVPVPEVMTWTLPYLNPKQTATLTYEMRVEPGAAQRPQLRNFVIARGQGPGGATDIAQDFSDAEVEVLLKAFKPLGDLVGVVFVDRNRSGSYEKEFDTPVNRARVVLTGGRIALTDKDGRYSFLNVPLGSHAVRLDPGTTPYPPLVMPQEGGLNGTQTVHVRGLTSADFPLAPLGGDISVIRRTTVQAGALTVRKIVFDTPDGYVVNLYLDSEQAIRQVRVTDPLPEGAKLLDGTPTFSGSLAPGEQIVSYRFEYSGEPRSAVTDPQVDWR